MLAALLTSAPSAAGASPNPSLKAPVVTDKTYTPEEIESRGTAIYEERIRHLVEPREKGKFIVIDVYSGDYEIDERDGAATGRLLRRRPGAMTWAVRVGYPTAYRWTRLQLARDD